MLFCLDVNVSISFILVNFILFFSKFNIFLLNLVAFKHQQIYLLVIGFILFFALL